MGSVWRANPPLDHHSLFPWSAITMMVYPFSNAVFITDSAHLSTAQQALTAASKTPVWHNHHRIGKV